MSSDNSPSQTDAKSNLQLSIVIPAFNEEKRLPYALDQIIEYFRDKKLTYEVIVVDDGSNDQTSGVVVDYSSKYSQVKGITLQENVGKKIAVATGVEAAEGDLILYQDADGAAPIEEIERLFREMEVGAQVAIGSRALFSTDTVIHTIWTRKILGRTFNTIVNVFVLPGIADTQCGFKMFKKEIAKYLFPKLRSHRFAFDVELLYLARKMGCMIAEVPINWNNIPGSKVNLLLDSADMFFDIIRIPFRRYGKLLSVDEICTQR